MVYARRLSETLTLTSWGCNLDCHVNAQKDERTIRQKGSPLLGAEDMAAELDHLLRAEYIVI